MKFAAAVFLIALASCTERTEVNCPAIEKLAQRDATADARAALAKGDRSLLMLGGFVGEVPGVPDSNVYSTRMVEGTSDATTEACRQQRGIAEAYAAKYNRTIIQSQ